MIDTTPISATDMPPGDYAIVEALGHRTLIGRVCEIERFGTKMLQVEPLFCDVMLGPVLLGGASIYQFTPVGADTAFQRRPTRNYELPASVFATVPAVALPNAEEGRSFFDPVDAAEDVEFAPHEDGCTCLDCVGF